MALWKNRIVEYKMVKVSEIVPNPQNPKEHPDYQLNVLNGLISEVGVVQNIVINRVTGHLVDGEARYFLAQDNKEIELPATIVDLNQEEELKILLAFDATATYARSIPDRVNNIVQSIIDKTHENGLKNLINAIAERSKIKADNGDGNKAEEGIGSEENQALVDQKNKQIDQLQEQLGVAEGDVWKIMDGIFVMCGDSRDSNHLDKLIEISGIPSICGVFTSPPYAEQRSDQYGGIPEAEYVDWWKDLQANCKTIMEKDGNFFLNIKPHTRDDYQKSLYVNDLVSAMVRRYGWMWIDEFCWLKSSMPKEVIRHFKNAFEMVYQFTLSKEFRFFPKNVAHISENVPNATGPGTGDTTWSGWQGKGAKSLGEIKGVSMGLSYPSNVITAYSKKSFGHEAAFPVDLPDFFIKAYSSQGDTWYDPFAGSGTVGEAAMINKRNVIMMEIKPRYVSIIINRFKEQFDITAEKVHPGKA